MISNIHTYETRILRAGELSALRGLGSLAEALVGSFVDVSRVIAQIGFAGTRTSQRGEGPSVRLRLRGSGNHS
jgi:hypothetical protein